MKNYRVGHALGHTAGRRLTKTLERLGGGPEGKPHSTRAGRIAAGVRKIKRGAKSWNKKDFKGSGLTLLLFLFPYLIMSSVTGPPFIDCFLIDCFLFFLPRCLTLNSTSGLMYSLYVVIFSPYVLLYYL